MVTVLKKTTNGCIITCAIYFDSISIEVLGVFIPQIDVSHLLDREGFYTTPPPAKFYPSWPTKLCLRLRILSKPNFFCFLECFQVYIVFKIQ